MGGKNVLVDYELSPIDLYESEETMTSKVRNIILIYIILLLFFYYFYHH
jgi:hypothetical protein